MISLVQRQLLPESKALHAKVSVVESMYSNPPSELADTAKPPAVADVSIMLTSVPAGPTPVFPPAFNCDIVAVPVTSSQAAIDCCIAWKSTVTCNVESRSIP